MNRSCDNRNNTLRGTLRMYRCIRDLKLKKMPNNTQSNRGKGQFP